MKKSNEKVHAKSSEEDSESDSQMKKSSGTVTKKSREEGSESFEDSEELSSVLMSDLCNNNNLLTILSCPLQFLQIAA